jgi:hypothetical protein
MMCPSACMTRPDPRPTRRRGGGVGKGAPKRLRKNSSKKGSLGKGSRSAWPAARSDLTVARAGVTLATTGEPHDECRQRPTVRRTAGLVDRGLPSMVLLPGHAARRLARWPAPLTACKIGARARGGGRESCPGAPPVLPPEPKTAALVAQGSQRLPRRGGGVAYRLGRFTYAYASQRRSSRAPAGTGTRFTPLCGELTKAAVSARVHGCTVKSRAHRRGDGQAAIEVKGQTTGGGAADLIDGRASPLGAACSIRPPAAARVAGRHGPPVDGLRSRPGLRG